MTTRVLTDLDLIGNILRNAALQNVTAATPTAGSQQVANAAYVDNAIAQASSAIYYCEYGATAYTDIIAALDDDKLPALKYNGVLYLYTQSDDDAVIFVANAGNVMYAVIVDDGDNWTTASINLQELLTFDTSPIEDSQNPVESGGVYTALQGKQDVLTIDAAPVEDSGNPVASGGVFTALAGKQDNLTIDATPTLNSTNPVQSGGTASALALKAPLNSPDLTGTPTAPTPTSGDNSTKIATTAFVEGEIARTVSGVYRPAGSIAFAQLPALSADHVGEVYDITDAFTTTADFVEGAGINYPAGTDVAIVEPSTGVYKYDAMSGMVDLSNYYTDSEVDTLLAGKQDALTFDNSPTQNSDNPVKSNGVWAALQGKQDNLPVPSSADNGKVLGINNGAYSLTIPEKGIYWATYGTTTFAELNTAISGGMLPACIYDDLLFICYGVTAEAIAFVAQSAEAVNEIWVEDNDTWDNATIYLQRSLTFDNVPSQNSSNPVKSSGIWAALQGKQNSLPATSAADNGKVLGVSGGVYALITQSVGTTDIFWATYGVTTFAEIQAAITAGQLPLCHYQTVVSDDIYFYQTVIPNAGENGEDIAIFICSLGTNISFLTVDDTDTWDDSIAINLQTALTFDAQPVQNSDNPVKSGGVYSALALKAPLASPAFTGDPTAPTQSSSDNSTKIATTAFVNTAITNNQELFWCTRGTTTYAQISAAITAGKLPVCKDGQLMYVFASYEQGTEIQPDAVFVHVMNNIDRLHCDENNYWYDEPFYIQSRLPVPSSADNGKFLRIVNGVYALSAVAEAAEEEF